MFSLEDWVVKRLTKKTGFPVTVGAMSGNPLTGRFQVSEVVVENPDGYPVRDFVSVVEARARISPRSLVGKTLQVREASVHLRRLTGVRSELGTVNIEQFREALERRDPEDESGGAGGRREIHVGRMRVKVDHIVTRDFSGGAEGSREYPILFEEEFRDIRDLIALGPPLLKRCDAAGLSFATDSIFATLLPAFLWERIGRHGW